MSNILTIIHIVKSPLNFWYIYLLVILQRLKLTWGDEGKNVVMNINWQEMSFRIVVWIYGLLCHVKSLTNLNKVKVMVDNQYNFIHSSTQNTNTNTIMLPPQVGIENKVTEHHELIPTVMHLFFYSLWILTKQCSFMCVLYSDASFGIFPCILMCTRLPF